MPRRRESMSLKIFARILTGYGLILLIMLAIAAVTFVQIGQMEQAASKVVTESLPARQASDDVLTQVVNQETGMRGFIISGQTTSGGVDRFLDPYMSGTAVVPVDADV